MRKTFVLLGAMLMLGAALPTAAAHWDAVLDGSGDLQCQNEDNWDGGDDSTPYDDTDTFDPGPEDTCGVAGRVVGFAGPSVVGTGGAVAGAAGAALCDIEVGDVTGGLGGSASASLNEVEIDENEQPDGQVPDNTWDDGGFGAACHVDTYANKKWNTAGCGEADDHGFARATTPLPLPVFVSTGCDLGSVSSSQDPVNAVLGVTACTVNQVFEGTPGETPGCLTTITNPPASGYADCQPDGSSDDGNFGYADTNSGPAVPTKGQTQTTVGGSLDCTGDKKHGSAVVFVFANVDLAQTQVSGPATHVWTTGVNPG